MHVNKSFWQYPFLLLSHFVFWVSSAMPAGAEVCSFFCLGSSYHIWNIYYLFFFLLITFWHDNKLLMHIVVHVLKYHLLWLHVGIPFKHHFHKCSYYEEELFGLSAFAIVHLLFSIIMDTAFKLRSQPLGCGSGNTEALGITVLCRYGRSSCLLV